MKAQLNRQKRNSQYQVSITSFFLCLEDTGDLCVCVSVCMFLCVCIGVQPCGCVLVSDVAIALTTAQSSTTKRLELELRKVRHLLSL